MKEEVTKQSETIPDENVSDVMMARYMLSSIEDIPEEQRKFFEQYYLMISKANSLAVIGDDDIHYYKLQLKLVMAALDLGLFPYAREEQVATLQELQLSRARGGRQLEVGFAGVRKSETVSKVVETPQVRSWKKNIFRRKKREVIEMEEQ